MVKNLSYENVDYLELRLDVIEDITSSKATDIIKSIKQITQTPIILTNRTKKEGGLFDKSEEERITILLENAHLVEITDIELSTDEELRQKVIDKANKTIISYHNFEKTPDKEFLQEIIDSSFEIGDIPKIAVKPNKLEICLANNSNMHVKINVTIAVSNIPCLIQSLILCLSFIP